LSDGYLKYVAWSLNDKDAHVRLAAVEALREVYQKHEGDPADAGRANNSASSSLSNGSALDLLTQRFSKRYCELIRDKNPLVALSLLKNPLVALSALLLVECLVAGDMIGVEEDFVRSEVDAFLALLLLDRSEKVRRAAGKLAAVIVDKRASAQQQEQEQQAKRRKKKSGGRSKKQEEEAEEEHAARIRGVFEALGELVEGPLSPGDEDEDEENDGTGGNFDVKAEMSTDLQVAACAAVVPHLPFLVEDWDLLAKAALSCAEEDEREGALRTVLACVRANNEAHSGSGSHGGRKGGKRKGGAGAAAAGAASIEHVTLALAQPVSVLFARCKGSRNAALTSLLSGLLCEMKLELFVARREEAKFSSILRCLVDIGRSNAAAASSSSDNGGGDSTADAEPRAASSSSSSSDARRSLSAVAQCLGHLCRVGPQVTRDKAQAAATELVKKCRKARGPAINVLLSAGLYRPDITAGEAKEEFEGLLASLQEEDGDGGKKGRHGASAEVTAETAALMLLWTLKLKRQEAPGAAAEDSDAAAGLLGQEASLFINALLSSKSSSWAQDLVTDVIRAIPSSLDFIEETDLQKWEQEGQDEDEDEDDAIEYDDDSDDGGQEESEEESEDRVPSPPRRSRRRL